MIPPPRHNRGWKRPAVMDGQQICSRKQIKRVSPRSRVELNENTNNLGTSARDQRYIVTGARSESSLSVRNPDDSNTGTLNAGDASGDNGRIIASVPENIGENVGVAPNLRGEHAEFAVAVNMQDNIADYRVGAGTEQGDNRPNTRASTSRQIDAGESPGSSNNVQRDVNANSVLSNIQGNVNANSGTGGNLSNDTAASVNLGRTAFDSTKRQPQWAWKPIKIRHTLEQVREFAKLKDPEYHEKLRMAKRSRKPNTSTSTQVSTEERQFKPNPKARVRSQACPSCGQMFMFPRALDAHFSKHLKLETVIQNNDSTSTNDTTEDLFIAGF